MASAVAVWVPMASMVTIAPWMSTLFNTSGMAVISLDFSSQANRPRHRPYSPAHTLTQCIALRSSACIVAAACGFAIEGEDGLLDAGTGDGFAPQGGLPGGEGGLEGGGLEGHEESAKDIFARPAVGQEENRRRASCSLKEAQRAMAVGPLAPARMASTAMTMTLGRG